MKVTLDSLHFRNEKELDEWLNINHDKSPGIWMIYYKKHTGIPSVSYNDALDVALSHGWIDSIIKSIDGERYARKFTPRKDTTKWSDINRKRVEELFMEGRMREWGLMKIESYIKTGKITWGPQQDIIKSGFEIPDFFIREMGENEPALRNFNNLPPHQQKRYIMWIMTAKGEETRKKRISESVSMLKSNLRLGLK